MPNQHVESDGETAIFFRFAARIRRYFVRRADLGLVRQFDGLLAVFRWMNFLCRSAHEVRAQRLTPLLRACFCISYTQLKIANTGLLPKLSNWAYGFKRGTNLVMESNEAFNRTIYHLHQELEFTVPFERTWEMCHRFLELYETMYSKEMPYALIEIRFTPAEHGRTFIGAGRARRSTWIDLICNDSPGFEKYYAAAEEIIKEIGARPHLGKYCQSLGKKHLSDVHGDDFERFLELMREHDPENKFANDFTQRLFRD